MAAKVKRMTVGPPSAGTISFKDWTWITRHRLKNCLAGDPDQSLLMKW